jgi:Outer membrane protein beta-barrel family/Carboxypeptidase regulatory-like domain
MIFVLICELLGKRTKAQQLTTMRKLYSLLFAGLFYSFIAEAQSASVKGTVTDTINKKQLHLTTISLIRKSDSILIRYARTAKDGAFEMKNLPAGNFIVMITHPSFADYADDLQLDENSNVDMGSISLTPKSKLLEEIIIKKTIPAIQIKGDTIIYKADSFQVNKGATVEDLLKKLPGLKVDKNGQVTAQGERVQKVLVDGEEFFSDDPTIATRNLMADMVDDVQVFDKKSDQAEFSGIDDGLKTKTINLKLKEDKKKGYFGKLELGTDFKDYWNNNAMLNAFKGKRKISAFGIMSNTGKTGLNWEENMNYGGMSGNMEMGASDDGGMYISVNNWDEFDGGQFWGEGLPKSWSGGLHFSDKWNNDRSHLNGNYRYNKISNEATSTTETQYILPDTLYFNNQLNRSFGTKFRNKLEGIYEFQIDSSTSIKINANAITGESKTVGNFFSEALNEESETVNNSLRQTSSDADNRAFNSGLILRKKFKKQGHTFSVNLNQAFTRNEALGYLKANNKFYGVDGGIVREDFIDQQKINKNENLTLSSRFSYTQPISKKSYLEFNYTLANSQLKSQRTTLEKANPADPKYEYVVDSLSNDFDYNTISNTGGINYRFVKPKKFNFSIGGAVSQNSLRQKDLNRDTTYNYNFVNFFPSANMQFTLKGNKGLRFNYNGSTQQPSIEQLQPILDNNDPLNIYVGNPDLRVAVNHRFNGSFNMYDFLSGGGLWTNLSYRFTQHAFSTRDIVDSLGRRIYQTVNVDGNYSINNYFDYYFKIKKPGIDIGLGYNFQKRRNINFVNGLKNTANSLQIGPSFNIGYNKEKKVNINYRAEFSYNFSKSSIRPDVETKYWTQVHNVNFGIFLPWKFEINTDVEFNLRQKTDVFDRDQNVTSWNASIDKKILKNDAAKIRIYAFDILNQNRGFNRNINSNLISERTYNTIRQYFMLSFTWNFGKNGKPKGF